MSAEASPNIVYNGLTLYLDAANSRSYPGTGTTWTDLSNYGNNGTFVNSPTFDSGNNGSIVFNGTNYVSISDSVSINPGTGSFSIVVWVNSDPSGGDLWDLWVAKRTVGANGYYVGANNGVGAKFMLGNNASSRTDTGFLSYTNNTWAMYTAILDSSTNTQSIIKNNYQESSSVTASGGTYSNTATLSIGADAPAIGAYYVNGKIPVVQMYNRALTSSEVIQNYNALKSRYGL